MPEVERQGLRDSRASRPGGATASCLVKTSRVARSTDCVAGSGTISIDQLFADGTLDQQVTLSMAHADSLSSLVAGRDGLRCL